MKKERFDKVLVDLGYFETKSKAAAAILAGDVKLNDEVITKAGFQTDVTKKLDIVVKTMPYVSRGGFKLEKALDTFLEVNVKDRVCIDAGASTGGFSDCLLQRGARKIYAVDVGYGQLAWKIRSDNRVKTIEKTNIKNCEFSSVYDEGDEIADLLVADLSFIALEKVLPNLKLLLNKEFSEMVCLIKPQFEAGKALIEKGGVVRDKNVHIDVINRVIAFAKSIGYETLNLTNSPIKGPSGNIEYLVHLAICGDIQDFDVKSVVFKAFETLNSNEA